VRRLAASVAGALLLAGAASWLAGSRYGSAAGTSTLRILAPLGVGTVLALEVLVLRGRPLGGGLRRRLGISAAIAAVQLVVGVAAFATGMFVSSHDAFFMALVVAYAALLGGWSASVVGRAALRDVEAVRHTLAAVGDGRRDVRTGVTSDDELGRLAADLDAMIDRLAREERARRMLIAAVSHDLRTPLTSLRLLAEAIDDGIGDEATRREYAARMATHVHGLSTLVEDLFELSRLESGDLAWSLGQVRLDRLVEETIDAMRPAADAHAIRVEAELEPAETRANPERLQRVLFNLIQNAIRHTPADGSVTVRAQRIGGEVIVEVADTGGGIPADERNRVFEPFFRGGPDAARTDGGAGLGLAISRAIVEAHGGRIWLADAPAGTSVRIALRASG
jgi:signal transduction histidine kinase